jgi:hypothetical protein
MAPRWEPTREKWGCCSADRWGDWKADQKAGWMAHQMAHHWEKWEKHLVVLLAG